MESASFLYGRPTWAIALVLFVLVFAAGEAGHRLGRREARIPETDRRRST